MKLEVILNQRGDLITNISEAHSMAKGCKQTLHLHLECGRIVLIKPESDIQDLISIALLEIKVAELTTQSK